VDLARVCRRFEGEIYMSVKIRLARHGLKKDPFIELLWLIVKALVMVDSWKMSVHTIRC